MDDAGAIDPSGSITILYQQWRQGQSDALGELIARFQPRLLAPARSTFAGKLPRIADAEDALQSAMISFWEGVEVGDFRNDLDRNDLWNVLGLITVRKALKLQEKESAQKRGGGRVVTGVPMESLPARDSESRPEIICAELLEMLDPDLRSFALLRLMGHSNLEIAAQFGCSERKIQRKLQLIRAVWENEAGK